MTERSINLRAAKLLQLEAEAKELGNRIKKLKEEIQKEMGDETEISTNKYLIKWILVNQSRFDTTGFKAEHPDLYNIWTKDAPQKKFSVAEKQ